MVITFLPRIPPKVSAFYPFLLIHLFLFFLSHLYGTPDQQLNHTSHSRTTMSILYIIIYTYLQLTSFVTLPTLPKFSLCSPSCFHIITENVFYIMNEKKIFVLKFCEEIGKVWLNDCRCSLPFLTLNL